MNLQLLNMKTKIVIAGGSGFLGQMLANFYVNKGSEVVILSRNPSTKKGITTVHWDGKLLGNWVKEVDGATALINLTGKSVDCRYTEANKAAILNSRVDSTHVLGKVVEVCKNPPLVWLNAGSATIYRHAEDRAMDELTGDFGTGFSVEVCKAWENEFFSHPTPQTRKVAMRISMVLGQNGGVWPVLSKLTKLGLGGKMGPGTQYFSWIHELDFCNAADWLLNHEIEGAVNVTAPNPLTNADFMAAMRKRLHMPFGLPQPLPLLQLGALLLGTETELVLKSRRVIPTRLSESGFKFNYPTIKVAVETLK